MQNKENIVLETEHTMASLEAMLKATPTKKLYAKLAGQSVRLGISTQGDMLYLTGHNRRHGLFLLSHHLAMLTQIKAKDTTAKTWAETRIHDLRLRKRFLEKNRHPNLWENLVKECEGITEENFQKLLAFEKENADKAIGDNWNLVYAYAHSLGLPSGEKHKTLTLKSVMDSWHYETYAPIIAQMIAERKDYRHSWRKDYDCSLQLKNCDDGIYRGWLSQEFKDCSNGHYWLLVSPTQCIFGEDD